MPDQIEIGRALVDRITSKEKIFPENILRNHPIIQLYLVEYKDKFDYLEFQIPAETIYHNSSKIAIQK